MHPVPPTTATVSSSSSASAAAPDAPNQQGAPSAPRPSPQPKAVPQQPPLNTAFALQFLSAWTEFSSGLFVRDREKFEEYCSDVLEAAHKAGAKVPEEAYSASRVEHPQAQVDRSGEALRLAQLRQLQQQRLANAQQQQQQQQHGKQQEPRTERAANTTSTIAQKICGCADTSKATAGTLDCDQLHRFMALTVLTKRGLSIPLLNLGHRLIGVWLLADFFRKRDQVAAYLQSLVEVQQPEAEKADANLKSKESEATASNDAAGVTETKEEQEDTEMKDATGGEGQQEVKQESAERSSADTVEATSLSGLELDGTTQAAMKDVLSYLKSQGMKWNKDLAERFANYLTTEGNPFCPRFLSRDKAGPMGSLLNAPPELNSFDERFIFIPDAKIFCQTFCYAATWAPLTDLERNLSCLVFGDATGSPSAVVAHPAFVRSPADKQQQAAGRPPQALVVLCNDSSGKYSQAAVLQWISMSTPSWIKYAKECREAMSWIPREHTGFLLTRVLQPATTQAIPQAATPADLNSMAKLQQMSPAAAMAIFQQQAGMALRSEPSNQTEVPLRHQPLREASRRSRRMDDQSSESEFDSDDESSSESAESEGDESMNTRGAQSTGGGRRTSYGRKKQNSDDEEWTG